MEFEQLKIKDVVLIKPNVFEDERGHFFESYQANKYYEASFNINSTEWPPNPSHFIQENVAYNSDENIIRGLHFQKRNSQGKLVRVTNGGVLDVVVDNRRESESYGDWLSVELNDTNNYSLWIPPGFAHGYRTLTKNSTMIYKCTNLYDPKDEEGFDPFDKSLKIVWGIPKKNAILSKKDLGWPEFPGWRIN